MEQKFQLLSVKPILKDKLIHLIFSLDLDEDTIPDNVYLMQEKPRRHVSCETVVSGRTLDLRLKEWPVPNSTYSLIIEPGKIFSITENPLEDFLPIHFSFKSEVTSTVKIISPTNFEEITGDLKVTWQESGANPTLKYYVEVATENIFQNLVFKTAIDKTINPDADNKYTFVLSSITEPGQYFIRVRAENNKEYGKWSEVISIVLPKEKTVVPNPQPEEKEKPKGPEILDLTKQENKKPLEPSIVETAKKVIYQDELPKSFDIVFSIPVNIEDAKVKIERREF